MEGSYFCGVTVWRGVDAVFAAEYGQAPSTTFYTYYELTVMPRHKKADSLIGAAFRFIEDVELPFPDDAIHHIVTFSKEGWGLWAFSIEAEKAGENPVILVESYQR